MRVKSIEFLMSVDPSPKPAFERLEGLAHESAKAKEQQEARPFQASSSRGTNSAQSGVEALPSQRMFVPQGPATYAFGLITHHRDVFAINQDRPRPRPNRLWNDCLRMRTRASTSRFPRSGNPTAEGRPRSRDSRSRRQTHQFWVRKQSHQVVENRKERSVIGQTIPISTTLRVREDCDRSETYKPMYALLCWYSLAMWKPGGSIAPRRSPNESRNLSENKRVAKI